MEIRCFHGVILDGVNHCQSCKSHGPVRYPSCQHVFKWLQDEADCRTWSERCEKCGEQRWLEAGNRPCQECTRLRAELAEAHKSGRLAGLREAIQIVADYGQDRIQQAIRERIKKVK